MRTDIYQKITNQIVSELEKGVRPWLKPWNAEHAAGRITRPLRGNGIPYQGINVRMLWSAAMDKGYAAPVWMTFKQALEFKAHVRKGEQGSLVVYADRIIRAETDTATGEESEYAIPFMKGYTVFNVEQIDGLPERFYAKPEPPRPFSASRGPKPSLPRLERMSGTAATWLIIMSPAIMCRCRGLRCFAMPKAITRPSVMNVVTGLGTSPALTVISGASALATKVTPWKNWSPSLAQPSCPPTSN
jgi:hypothetical protein